eukprot:CAMPEP_0178489988 /NCGR_PEP_ID=MMETSP0696-20121128/10659_1 /TAXON_ID=265572 /ORGANISM="Extubocellulus spinifer, Strain CCMP396" /LENGTH=189 /DNA_ID=CAMNT_0020117805 /DNA_START=63 /DNA_END=629 /DNA_ORIENTATION=+
MAPPEGSDTTTANTANNEIATLLETATTNLQIRSEVQTCLSSLLTDVELATTLSTALQSSVSTTQLRHKLTKTQLALDESRAVVEHETTRRIQLGDAFLVEWVKLSTYIQELERWRENNQVRIDEYDDMKRQLGVVTDRAKALELVNEEIMVSRQSGADGEKEKESADEEKGGEEGAVVGSGADGGGAT